MRSKDRTEAPGAMNRRGFLRLSGASVVGAALLGMVGSGWVSAQEQSPYSSLLAEFEEAAERYNVPVKLMLAMGYVNTRWEMPPPEASDHEPGKPHGRGAYGIMQLVKNDDEDTLGEASGEKPARLGDYFGAVSGRGKRRLIKAVAGLGAGQLYAEQVFDTLRRGTFETILDGEQVALPAEEEL